MARHQNHPLRLLTADERAQLDRMLFSPTPLMA